MSQERDENYLDLLGMAYDVSSEPQRFDDLVLTAHHYFFGGEDRAELRDELPRWQQSDEKFDTRMARLSGLVEKELATSSAGNINTFHAQLSIDPHSLLVSGNSAAEQLMGLTFPCRLEQLPLDHRSLKLFESSNKMPADSNVTSNSEGQRDRIVLATIEKPALRSCLALIKRPYEAGSPTRIAISYIDWSNELLDRLGSALNLTHSELQILEGYLHHKSQRDIAEERQRSLDTVKAQSKSILRKTGCARMTDVVALAASIAYLLRQYPESDHKDSLKAWVTPTTAMRTLARPGGRKLAWYDYGDGPNVVLWSHGFLQGPFFPASLLSQLHALGLRLICPSRPGYGYSSQSGSHDNFNQTVVDDATALVNHLGIEKMTVFAHQGGTSHAFRIAKALNNRVHGLVMVDGGIPIDEDKHLSHMNTFTRLAGVACKHSPSVMIMLLNIGLPVYKRRGVRWFFKEFFKTSNSDYEAVRDPETERLHAYGIFHIMQQGSTAWVRCGNAAMSDWSADFDAVGCKQSWTHGRDCPVMGAHFVEEYIREKRDEEITVLPNVGFNILYQRPDIVLQRMHEMANGLPPAAV